MAIRIGCGSWRDAEYVGLLYPRGAPANDRLHMYAQWFERVEVNSTAYAMPRADQVAIWAQQTPEGFIFDLKVPNLIADNPRAAAAQSGLIDRLLSGVAPLVHARKFGAFLLLLDPKFGPKENRLEELDPLIEQLRPHLLAVELRHRDWVQEGRRAETLRFFRERELVWVALDMPQIDYAHVMPVVDEITNPRLAYLRLHGRNDRWARLRKASQRHEYAYTEHDLAELTERIRHLAGKAENVHVSANNHAQDFAPKTALALQALLGMRSRPPGWQPKFSGEITGDLFDPPAS